MNLGIPDYKILFVEDDESHYQMLSELLSLTVDCRFEVDWAPTYEAALEVTRRHEHDVYLLDYRLGERNGVDLLKEMVADGCKAPVIMLTAYGDRQLVLAAMKAGATDYLVKAEINGALLERTIRHAIGQRKAQDQLVASQTYARYIINSSLDMIVAVNRDLRVTDFNPAAEKSFGYPPDEVLGKPFTLFYADAREAAEVSESVLNGRTCLREVINVRKNGERFPSYLAASALRDARGNLVGSVGIYRDITDRKRVEEDLRRTRDELERKVLERTATLTAEIQERKWLEQERDKLIGDLQEALTKIRTLSGIINLCAQCKRIRDDEGQWHQLEAYIQRHSDARFSHGICPDCAGRFRDTLRAIDAQGPAVSSTGPRTAG